MFTLGMMIVGLVIIVGLLAYALAKALNIPKESADNYQQSSAMFEFPNLFPWPLK